jgi:hypothetical protein
MKGGEAEMETEVQKFAEFVKRMDSVQSGGQRFSSDELRRIAKTMKEGIEEAEAGNIRLGKITVEEYRQMYEGLYSGFVCA